MKLLVEVTWALNLHDKQFFADQDPYVSAVSNDCESRTQHAPRGGTEPVWLVKHSNRLVLALGDDENSFVLSVWNENFMIDDLIGRVEIQRSTIGLQSQVPTSGWYQLDTGGHVECLFRELHPDDSDSSQAILVEALRAQGIKNVQFLVAQDPYVVASTLPSDNSYAATQCCVSGGEAPAWSRKSSSLMLLQPESRDSVLRIQLMNSNSFQSDDLIGMHDALLHDVTDGENEFLMESGGDFHCSVQRVNLSVRNIAEAAEVSGSAGGTVEELTGMKAPGAELDGSDRALSGATINTQSFVRRFSNLTTAPKLSMGLDGVLIDEGRLERVHERLLAAVAEVSDNVARGEASLRLLTTIRQKENYYKVARFQRTVSDAVVSPVPSKRTLQRQGGVDLVADLSKTAIPGLTMTRVGQWAVVVEGTRTKLSGLDSVKPGSVLATVDGKCVLGMTFHRALVMAVDALSVESRTGAATAGAATLGNSSFGFFEQPEKKGHMLKLPQRLALRASSSWNWHERRFSLRGGVLRWFMGDLLRGQWPLLGSQVVLLPPSLLGHSQFPGGVICVSRLPRASALQMAQASLVGPEGFQFLSDDRDTDTEGQSQERATLTFGSTDEKEMLAWAGELYHAVALANGGMNGCTCDMMAVVQTYFPQPQEEQVQKQTQEQQLELEVGKSEEEVLDEESGAKPLLGFSAFQKKKTAEVVLPSVALGDGVSNTEAQIKWQQHIEQEKQKQQNLAAALSVLEDRPPVGEGEGKVQNMLATIQQENAARAAKAAVQEASRSSSGGDISAGSSQPSNVSSSADSSTTTNFLRADSRYRKYTILLRSGMSEKSVRDRMAADGLSRELVDSYFGGDDSISSSTASPAASPTAAPPSAAPPTSEPQASEPQALPPPALVPLDFSKQTPPPPLDDILDRMARRNETAQPPAFEPPPPFDEPPPPFDEPPPPFHEPPPSMEPGVPPFEPNPPPASPPVGAYPQALAPGPPEHSPPTVPLGSPQLQSPRSPISFAKGSPLAQEIARKASMAASSSRNLGADSTGDDDGEEGLTPITTPTKHRRTTSAMKQHLGGGQHLLSGITAARGNLKNTGGVGKKGGGWGKLRAHTAATSALGAFVDASGDGGGGGDVGAASTAAKAASEATSGGRRAGPSGWRLEAEAHERKSGTAGRGCRKGGGQWRWWYELVGRVGRKRYFRGWHSSWCSRWHSR
jgi:hypothetical protein